MQVPAETDHILRNGKGESLEKKGGSIEEDVEREIKERTREYKKGKGGAKGKRMRGSGKRSEKQEKMKQYTFVGEDERRRK